MTALYHRVSCFWSVFFLKRHTPFSCCLLSLPLSSSDLFFPLKLCFSLFIHAVMWGWIISLPFLAPIRIVQLLVDFMLPWLRKIHYVYVPQLYHRQWAAVNLLAAVAQAQKQACTDCSTTDLPALAMLRLTPNDAVLQEGALPAV